MSSFNEYANGCNKSANSFSSIAFLWRCKHGWLTLSCRSWACLHSLPTGSDPSALASDLVRLLLFYDHPIRSGRSGQFPVWHLQGHPYRIFTFTRLSSHVSHHYLQFIALESIVSSLSDINPAYMRKGYRREVLLFLICAFCYVVGQLFVSQVSYSCPLLATRAEHVEDLIPEYSDEVHFYVLILGRHVLSDDIRSLCMQRPFSPSSGDLPVVSYWMGLWWVAVAQSRLHIICANWRRGHFAGRRLQVRSASAATLQTWLGTNLTRWSSTAGCTAPLWRAL